MTIDQLDPADPMHYEPHPCGYCCTDCGASANIGRAVRHSSRCDIAPREYVLPSGQAELPSSKRSQRRGTSANTRAHKDATARVSMAAAAKRGDLRLHYTDAEIALGVRSGQLSESDAMNQDF